MANATTSEAPKKTETPPAKAGDKKKPKESPRARFLRLAPKRMTVAIKRIGHIRNLSTRSNYEYTADEAAKIVQALRASVTLVEQAFAGRTEGPQGFSF